MSKPVATIETSGRYYHLHDNGEISHPGQSPSGEWRCIGAVRCNNFGREVERFTLAQVLAGMIEWKHKNGKQRVHLLDLDHGTRRLWMSPSHRVYNAIS